MEADHAFRLVRFEVAGKVAEMLVDFLASGAEFEEHETRPFRQAQRNQAEFGGIEILRFFHPGRGDQLAVEGIAPAVIGAGNRLRGTAAGKQARTAMPTGVGESAKRAVVIPEHDRRYPRQIDREIVPGLGNLIRAANQVPVNAKDAVHLPREEGGIGVTRGRQGLGFEEGQADPLVARRIERLRQWIAAAAGSSASNAGRTRPSLPTTTSRARRT